MPIYLITGVAGFIGCSLARELLKRGESVRGIDNFSSGKRENLEEFKHEIDFREADLLDTSAVNAACQGVDYILHQAAIPSVPKSVIAPLPSHQSNIDGTLNLLLAARDASVKRVVYASSSSVYGETPILPKREDMNPDPISPYAVQKLCGEYYMRSFFRVYGLETVSLRYFNVFGPYQDPSSQYSGVLAKFCTQLLRAETPTVFGDGEQTRDFTYVSNVVEANLLAATALSSEVAGKCFNIASGKQISLNAAVNVLRAIIGFSGDVNYTAPRKGDIKHSLADISLARRYLNYAPSVHFEEGLSKTVAWYQSTLSATTADR